MPFPARVSVVPPNVAWVELNTGKALPMFARYVAYLDAALQAVVAAATLLAPALVAVKRVSAVPMTVQLVDEEGFVTDSFARYFDYVDSCINALVIYANAHGVPTSTIRSQSPPSIAMVDPTTGLPTDSHARYLKNVDSILQTLIAAGV